MARCPRKSSAPKSGTSSNPSSPASAAGENLYSFSENALGLLKFGLRRLHPGLEDKLLLRFLIDHLLPSLDRVRITPVDKINQALVDRHGIWTVCLPTHRLVAIHQRPHLIAHSVPDPATRAVGMPVFRA